MKLNRKPVSKSVSRSLIETLEVRRLMAAEPVRINVGGSAYVDSTGNPWEADNFVTGGTALSNPFTVNGTADPLLYQARRRGTSINYAIPVENGTYVLKLNAVEPSLQAGQRVYTVSAEGQVKFSNVDIAGIVGPNTAMELTSAVTVNDGVANISINASVNQAMLSGLQLIPASVASVDKTALYTNTVIGAGYQHPVPITLSNVGPGPLSILSASVLSGANSGLFQIFGATVNGLLQPGQSTTYSVYFVPPAGTTAGVKTSTIRFVTSDPDRQFIDVPVRAIATTGEGGSNEPSLQRIFDTYNIPVRTGDASSATTQLFSNTSAIGANDEVGAQLFAKAGAGPVTFEPLAVFGVASRPAVYLNWYNGQNPDDSHQVFRVPVRSAQTLNVEGNGSYFFDPTNTEFGFSTNWPGFADGSNIATSRQRTVYQSDALNTQERTAVNRHKTRVYPLKNADGSTVANAYIVAFEEFVNDTNGAYDNQDFVAIVRNVRPVATPRLTVTNQDGAGMFNNQLVFSNFASNPGTNASKATGTVRLNNFGSVNATITNLSVPANYTLVNAPATPIVLVPNSFVDLAVRMTATTAGDYKGTLAISTDDPTRSTINVTLSGHVARVPENGEEMTLGKIVGPIFGYKVNVGTQNEFNLADGANVKIGDEVLSELWQQADPGKRIYARQLAAYHTSNMVSKLYVFPESDPGSVNATNAPALFTQARSDSQTLLPRALNTASAPAEAYFNMAADAVFGFAVRDGSNNAPVYYSINALNDTKVGAPDQHLIRFYPAKDAQGIAIPDAYLMAIDYNGVNYDYQDAVYFISNIRPKAAPSAVKGIGLRNSEGDVVINWAPAIESNVAGYNVYRSTQPATGFVKLNSSVIRNTFYVDTSAPSGQRVYYQFAAVTTNGDRSQLVTESIVL